MGKRLIHLSTASLTGVLLATIGAVVGVAPSSAAPVIQPGSSLEFHGSYCTANWVYDGAGGPYIGAAAHCSGQGVGERVNLATMSLGAIVEPIGTVAYISKSLDFLLVRLDPSVLTQVSAAMAGHPNIPTGVSTTSTAKQGDLIQFSGHGVGFDLTSVTQQQRVGVFNYFDDAGNQYVIGAVTPGDSGGPVADITDGNKAIGIVDTVGVSVNLPKGVNPGEEGVAVYALLQDAAANGFPISLRTV